MTKRATTNASASKKKKSSYAATRKSGSRSRTAKKKPRSRRRKKKSSWQKVTEAVVSGQALGVVLALMGIFTLLALFSSQRGSITAWWVDMMSLLFGVGVYWLPIVLIV